MFNLSNCDKSQAKYLQLADVIKTAIKNKQIMANDSLPSARTLGTNLKINRHTVMKAFAELIAQGWIESVERVGYRVVESLPVDGSQFIRKKIDYADLLDLKTDKNLHDIHRYRFVRKGATVASKTAETYEYNFAGGQPDLHLFPFKEFKSYISESLSRPIISEYGYGNNNGTELLKQQVSDYLRKSRGIIDRDIVITNGSQEAMYIVAQLLLKPGDKVAVEALGYPPAMAAFKSAGASIVPISQDSKGLIPDHLRQQIQKGNIRLVYLTPLHQYPTTVTLTIGRRMQIYELAAQYQIPIIEDDYDHEFHYRCQPLTPIAASDPKQLVIYISTLSKIMFAGARIGMMAVNQTLANAIAEYRLLISHKNNVVMQDAVARWMQSGGFERHLRRITRVNHKRRDHAVAHLKHQNLFDFMIPDGGMALWLSLKNKSQSARQLSNIARANNIFIQDEGCFHVNTQNNHDQHIRLGFAGMDECKFVQGTNKLANFLRN